MKPYNQHPFLSDFIPHGQIFDKRYFEEIRRRAWRPRNAGLANQDWTWGGGNGNSPRFMLNTDICLDFDIDNLSNCCTRINRLGNDGTNACIDPDIFEVECLSYADDHPRQAAVAAVTEFIGGANLNNDNNEPFYTSFSVAWEKATHNGWEGQLKPLATVCAPTPSPSPKPTVSPTTPLPTDSPTSGPTDSPVTATPTGSCHDVEDFLNGQNKTKNCNWVIDADQNRCQKFAHLCPVTCDECVCLSHGRVCTGGNDCCTGVCTSSQCSCLKKGEGCISSSECCSSECTGGGTCAGGMNI